jgi:hypothetical protein
VPKPNQLAAHSYSSLQFPCSSHRYQISFNANWIPRLISSKAGFQPSCASKSECPCRCVARSFFQIPNPGRIRETLMREGPSVAPNHLTVQSVNRHVKFRERRLPSAGVRRPYP